MNRRFDDVDILVVYMDGIVVDRHHILVAVGVDGQGTKQILGMAPGSSENARVAKDLLNDLVQRGLRPESDRLFVIDGSKALRSAINEVFGEAARVQHCRTHKVRNVTERLPEDLAAQVKSVMHAAYKLSDSLGIVKLKQQASWLKTEHPDAAASLLEGLEETFTVNRMKLPPTLMRCLCTTNIIENPNGAVRRVSRRVCRYRNADMALRWTATGFLEAEKSFRRIQGSKDLWILASASSDFPVAIPTISSGPTGGCRYAPISPQTRRDSHQRWPTFNQYCCAWTRIADYFHKNAPLAVSADTDSNQATDLTDPSVLREIPFRAVVCERRKWGNNSGAGVNSTPAPTPDLSPRTIGVITKRCLCALEHFEGTASQTSKEPSSCVMYGESRSRSLYLLPDIT